MTLSLRARLWIACALALAALGVERTAREGSVALTEGRSALARRDPDAALRHLGVAARAYVPGSPYTAAAYAELEAFARGEPRNRVA